MNKVKVATSNEKRIMVALNKRQGMAVLMIWMKKKSYYGWQKKFIDRHIYQLNIYLT